MALRSARFAPNLVLNTKEIAHFENRLKTLGALTVKKRRNEMQKVTNYALIPTKKMMIQKAPKGKTGSLKKSITTGKAVAIGLGSRVGSRTGPVLRGKSKRRVFHAHLVELGTKKKIKRVKRVGFGKKPFTFYSVRFGKVLRRVKINHGSKARPFIKPSINATEHLYVPRIKEKMSRILRSLLTGGGKKSGITKIGRK